MKYETYYNNFKKAINQIPHTKDDEITLRNYDYSWSGTIYEEDLEHIVLETLDFNDNCNNTYIANALLVEILFHSLQSDDIKEQIGIFTYLCDKYKNDLSLSAFMNVFNMYFARKPLVEDTIYLAICVTNNYQIDKWLNRLHLSITYDTLCCCLINQPYIKKYFNLYCNILLQGNERFKTKTFVKKCKFDNVQLKRIMNAIDETDILSFSSDKFVQMIFNIWYNRKLKVAHNVLSDFISANIVHLINTPVLISIIVDLQQTYNILNEEAITVILSNPNTLHYIDDYLKMDKYKSRFQTLYITNKLQNN